MHEPLPDALLQKHHWAAMAVDHTVEGVMITDARQRIRAINRAFSQITGYSEPEAIGRTPRLLASDQHDSTFYAALWHRLNAEGHWQGEVCNRRKNGDIWPCWLTISVVRDPAGATTHFVAIFADISSLKHTQTRLDHQAYHDPLTGLPNRLLFETRLHKALQHSQETGSLGAVLFLDLDRFKHINDSLGHTTGDLLLKAIAQRLKDHLRDIDTVARLGGDEFVVLLPGLLQASDAHSIARKLLASFSTPLQAGDHQLMVSTSIGSCLFPSDGTDAVTLIKHADTAMYRSKAKGRNRVEAYTRDLSTGLHERINLEHQLRHAIERNELTLHYQPIIGLPHQQMVGAEALLRWHHPQLGEIPPKRFITLAEESGSILTIGNWVLENACRQLQQWRRHHPTFGPLSINITGTQLRQPCLIERIRYLLTRYQLTPGSLQLEIAEHGIMGQAEHTLSALEDLKQLGIQLAIDNFGTGYSSLGYLKRLPLDTLKIARSFTRGLPDAQHETAIVHAIIALGRSLQLTVVAKGVETPEQQQWLIDAGCQHLQGHLISPALSASEFEETYLPTRLSDYSDSTAGKAPL
ncbi:hypothetical protein PS3A_09250 [Pseudomonas sp. 3A(2025)]